MYVNWKLFNSIFPTWSDYKTPMWYEINEDEKGYKIDIVVPGYEKEDFSLYVINNELNLDINSKEGTQSYSIIGSYRSNLFDFEKAEAKYKGGILKITVPKVSRKALESSRKAIEVS